MQFNSKKQIGMVIRLFGAAGLFAASLMAQYGGGGGSTGGTGGGGTSGGNTGSTGGMGSAGAYSIGSGMNRNFHLGFDRPEAWGLKYFASASLLSGLPVPQSIEGYRVGAVTVGFEVGWLPALDPGQMRIGFNGTAPENLNQAPIFARPVVRVALPRKFTAIVAAPPPFEIFGLTPRLIEFGLERPLWQGTQWTVGWRGYGQLGSIKGAFTCPQSVLAFAPGSSNNPTACVGKSADVATLRYAGTEFEVAYRIPRMPKVVPHAAAGGNFIDGTFQVHAPVSGGLDQTRLWTRGGTFSTTAGVSYLLTPQVVFTVDAFYSPLWVQRSPNAPVTNDGLFNVRAMLSYTFHR